jgi:drug/metabolite transporter (DMT)-like permease
MNNIKIIGIVLIVAGVLGAALGGFSFTRDTHKASLGPINLSVAEEKKVDIPLWASVAAIVAGAAVLAAGSKR